jgi:hypothetical protein
MAHRWLVLTALLILTAAPRASAAPGSAWSLQQAHQAFDRGDFQTAIAAFRSAYQKSQDARLLYNVALAHLRRAESGGGRADLVEADRTFRRFLLLVTPDDFRDPARREQVRAVRELSRRYLVEIERRLASGQRTSLGTPASGPVRAPASLATGRIDGRTRIAPSREVNRSSGLRLHWLAYGLGAAAGIGLAVTGGMALGASRDAEAAFQRGDAAQNRSLADRADRLALAADVLLGVALAATATGALLHLLQHRREQRPAQVEVRGTMVGLGLSFH